jgi:hypothetical protein
MFCFEMAKAEKVGQVLHFFDLCGVPLGWHATNDKLAQNKMIAM